MPQEHIEYSYNNKKYVRVKANSCYNGNFSTLSNGETYKDDDYVWVEVSKVKWLVNEKNDTVFSKYILISGIQLDNVRTCYNNNNFQNTNMYDF